MTKTMSSEDATVECNANLAVPVAFPCHMIVTVKSPVGGGGVTEYYYLTHISLGLI
jgi:hypothetical protein